MAVVVVVVVDVVSVPVSVPPSVAPAALMSPEKASGVRIEAEMDFFTKDLRFIGVSSFQYQVDSRQCSEWKDLRGSGYVVGYLGTVGVGGRRPELAW